MRARVGARAGAGVGVRAGVQVRAGVRARARASVRFKYRRARNGAGVMGPARDKVMR